MQIFYSLSKKAGINFVILIFEEDYMRKMFFIITIFGITLKMFVYEL
jgi:hypothetical protein